LGKRGGLITTSIGKINGEEEEKVLTQEAKKFRRTHKREGRKENEGNRIYQS